MKSYLSVLVVGLGVGGTFAGCDGGADGTGAPCEFAPSNCPSAIDLSKLCSTSGCKVDDQPATCTGAWCNLGPKQRLVVPLASAGSAAVRPNLDVRFGAPAPSALEAKLDGQPVSVNAVGGGSFTIEWASGPASPTTLELSFESGPSGRVSLEFHDEACETKESLACEGGGA